MTKNETALRRAIHALADAEDIANRALADLEAAQNTAKEATSKRMLAQGKVNDALRECLRDLAESDRL